MPNDPPRKTPIDLPSGKFLVASNGRHPPKNPIRSSSKKENPRFVDSYFLLKKRDIAILDYPRVLTIPSWLSCHLFGNLGRKMRLDFKIGCPKNHTNWTPKAGACDQITGNSPLFRKVPGI